MTTDNRTNEPTAEQILVDEWIRQADRAKSMTGMDAIWFPDAEETLAVLRANGLLSEGAPSEAQARAIRKLDNVQAILAGAQASVTDAVRELSLTSAALTAAQGAARPVNSFDTTAERVKAWADSLHVAQQEPLGDPVFRAAAAIAETQARRQNLPPEVIQGVTREHMQDAKAALTAAAGVAPQEPSQNETKSGNNFVSLDPEKMADVMLDAETALGDLPGSYGIAKELARALCEAYTEGKLTK